MVISLTQASSHLCFCSVLTSPSRGLHPTRGSKDDVSKMQMNCVLLTILNLSVYDVSQFIKGLHPKMPIINENIQSWKCVQHTRPPKQHGLDCLP